MNYDLAMMALEGLARAPMTVRIENGDMVVEGSESAFKELARLCLLLGGAQGTDDGFELQRGVHVTQESMKLRLQVI